MPRLIDDLRKMIDRHCKVKRFETPLRGLTLFRADEPVPRVSTTYRPALCILAQGRKQIMLGERTFEYDASNYLIVTVEVPLVARIVDATPKRPALGLTLELNPARIADVIFDMPGGLTPPAHPAALAVSELSNQLLDPIARLVQLLDDPEGAAVLAPLFEREILYRLLRGNTPLYFAKSRQLARDWPKLVKRPIGSGLTTPTA